MNDTDDFRPREMTYEQMSERFVKWASENGFDPKDSELRDASNAYEAAKARLHFQEPKP